MATLFITCIAIGGTVLALQFVLTMLGFLDLGSDVVDDIGLDDVGADGLEGGHDVDHGGEHHSGHAGDSFAWLWSIFSFRNITTGMTFFGLTGMAVRTADGSNSLQISAALIAGLGSMYGLHWLMRSIFRLARDNNLQVRRAIGETGTVYLSIPAAKSGMGKVHVNVQGRLEEFQAITPAPDKLVVGAKVVVIAVVAGETLAVVPVGIDAEMSQKLASMI